MTAVELDALHARLGALVRGWRPDARLRDLAPLVGGRSSLTYRLTVDADAGEGSEWIVVKMAPPGLEPVRNRDVLRQAKVQQAIAGTGRAPVARVLFTDTGDPPEVPPLYAMEFLEGESFEPVLDDCDALPAPEDLRGRQLEAAGILGRLHDLRPEAIGLAAEPEVPLDEEVARWSRIFETVPDDLRTGYEACARALLAALPTPVAPVVVHGEYRLGNMLARDDRVVAVIDWELWGREDPRVDLSWFLQYADATDQPSAVRPTPAGMPARAELLRAYEAELGAEVAGLAWFDAHARFKTAAIAAITCKHNRRREHPDPVQEARVSLIGRLIEQAHALLADAPDGT